MGGSKPGTIDYRASLQGIGKPAGNGRKGLPVKSAAIERADRLARFMSALQLKGYGQVDRNLAEALPCLQEALQACREAKAGGQESHKLAKALFWAGIVLKEAKEETGLQGFGSLSNEAGTLSLLFTGFALQGNGRKRKPKA